MDFLPDDEISADEILEEHVETEKEQNESQTIRQFQTEDALMSNAPKYANNTNTQEKEEIVEAAEKSENNVFVMVNKRPLPKVAKTYELENFEKRLLLIFNHVEVNGCERRLGTEKDVEALRNTFKKLEFTVIEMTDLTKRQIIEQLNKLTKTDFTDFGCVAVAVLTHGSEYGELKARDGFYYETEIINRLKADSNPSLLTKPRIILIQACRGGDDLAGVPVKQPPARVFKDSPESGHSYTLPAESDMLVMHSSYKGKASHRTIKGSWFVQTLCSKINEFARREDLESILVEVKNTVAIDHGEVKFNSEKQIHEINKQMPVTTSTFTRKLYFREYNNKNVPHRTLKALPFPTSAWNRLLW